MVNSWWWKNYLAAGTIVSHSGVTNNTIILVSSFNGKQHTANLMDHKPCKTAGSVTVFMGQNSDKSSRKVGDHILCRPSVAILCTKWLLLLHSSLVVAKVPTYLSWKVSLREIQLENLTISMPLLQCQSSSGLVGKSIWPELTGPRFKSWLDLNVFLQPFLY